MPVHQPSSQSAFIYGKPKTKFPLLRQHSYWLSAIFLFFLESITLKFTENDREFNSKSIGTKYLIIYKYS